MTAKPTLTMLIGVPGSGKSTWVKNQEFWKDGNTVILSTDRFIEVTAEGMKMTYNEAFQMLIKLAERDLADELEYAIEDNMNIVWDQTNITSKSRIKKLSKIPNSYYKIAQVFPIPPAETHKEWLNSKERVGKTIPELILNSMISNFELPSLSEGFDEIRFTEF